jgi:F420-non-reducing hydrogenase small subunit
VSKPQLAVYWCASCGGCDEAIVDLGADLLEIAAAADLVFWPAALDFKIRDVEALADGAITASLVSGAIRTDEQAHMARLLRRKSRLLVAFGACAHLGGIPGLANLVGRAEIFHAKYSASPFVDNPEGVVPAPRARLGALELALPGFWPQVHTLDQIVPVDYTLPGCPPPPALILAALRALCAGDLPPPGSVLAPDRTLCDTCPRQPAREPGRKAERLRRVHEVAADPDRCFLEQGIVCAGPATRGGCGESCIRGAMPCTGCFGPPAGVADQAASLLAAVAAMLDTRVEDAPALARALVDPAGTLGRYAVPASLLAARRDRTEP